MREYNSKQKKASNECVSTLFVSVAIWRQQSGQTLHKRGSDTVAMVLAAWICPLQSTDKCDTASLSILIINYDNVHMPVLHKLSALSECMSAGGDDEVESVVAEHDQ